MHKIILHRNAVKFYRKADNALKERVANAIDVIARNPHLDAHIKKLKGDLKQMYRFRMGDLSILYEIDDAQKTVWAAMDNSLRLIWQHCHQKST